MDYQKKSFKCHQCGKVGHIKRYCKFQRNGDSKAKPSNSKEKSYNAEAKYESDESVGLLAAHAMSACDSCGDYLPKLSRAPSLS